MKRSHKQISCEEDKVFKKRRDIFKDQRPLKCPKFYHFDNEWVERGDFFKTTRRNVKKLNKHVAPTTM